MYTKLSFRPQMNISAQLVIISRLLEVPGQELEKFLNQELTNNPALELANQGNFVNKRGVLAPSEVHSKSSSRTFTSRDQYYALPFDDLVENIAQQQSPVEKLIDQLSAILDKDQRETAIHLLYRLDHRGFLVSPPEQLETDLGLPVDKIKRAIKILHQLEPPGIGARDIQECFLLQCAHLESEGIDCQLVRRILTLAWREFLNQQWGFVARKTGESRKMIENACEFMRQNLTPYPLAIIEASNGTAGSLRDPDLIVLRNHHTNTSSFSLEIPGENEFELKISSTFEKILSPNAQDGHVLSTEERSWIRTHSDRAWMVIGALRQRWKTLRRIGEYLIEHQKGFLEYGPLHLRPMTRAVVARDLQLHESTISRAVSDKILQLPNGHLISLDNLFDPSLAVKEAVRILLHDHPKHLCDRKIAELLQAKGMNISRRTITKYRHELTISSNRRQPSAI
jgi:RNA polymerase sigma-54 factor